MSEATLLRRQFRLAHGLLETMMDRVGPEVAHWRPAAGGTAPAGACYAHVVWCEDLSVGGLLADGAPLALSAWAGRTGLSELPPLAAGPDWRAWACRVRLDLPGVRRYARAVYGSTDAYLAALPDRALPEQPAWLLGALLLTVSMRRGEIACLVALAGGRHERRRCPPA